MIKNVRRTAQTDGESAQDCIRFPVAKLLVHCWREKREPEPSQGAKARNSGKGYGTSEQASGIRRKQGVPEAAYRVKASTT